MPVNIVEKVWLDDYKSLTKSDTRLEYVPNENFLIFYRAGSGTANRPYVFDLTLKAWIGQHSTSIESTDLSADGDLYGATQDLGLFSLYTGSRGSDGGIGFTAIAAKATNEFGIRNTKKKLREIKVISTGVLNETEIDTGDFLRAFAEDHSFIPCQTETYDIQFTLGTTDQVEGYYLFYIQQGHMVR